MNEQRIKLAEAMGWVYHSERDETSPDFDLLSPTGVWTHPSRAYGRGGCPDPFTDANDDYAVLEWAIKNLDPDAYFAALTEVVGSYCYLHEYRIGYFARAALKLMDNGGD